MTQIFCHTSRKLFSCVSVFQRYRLLMSSSFHNGERVSSDKDAVIEGNAEIFSPSSVFYNPVQEFNRDLTIHVISEFAKEYILSQDKKRACTNLVEGIPAEENSTYNNDDKENCSLKEKNIPQSHEIFSESNALPGVRYDNGLRILEALGASGLRSVRFALEVPGINEIVCNDFDNTAVDYIKRNITHNNVANIITPSCADAALLMYQNSFYKNRFDVVDLDPYGSPTEFLDGAVKCIADGGLLCVTSTDMAVLCGNTPETCHSKYGSLGVRTPCCHEMAIRILLRAIESSANRYQRYITPLLSISADFYIRVFVIVKTGQAKVKESVTKLSHVNICNGCKSHSLSPIAEKQETTNGFKYVLSLATKSIVCEHCKHNCRVGGPIWSAPIHDVSFVEHLISAINNRSITLGTTKRIEGMLSLIAEELVDQPLYHCLPDLCKILHCTCPPLLQMRSAILHAGYEVSFSHAAKESLKTNAPMSVIWDILRCWIKDNPISSKWENDETTMNILNKEPELVANFTIHYDANPDSRQKNLLRWQVNPERDWGPKARATRGKEDSLESRRRKGIAKSKKSNSSSPNDNGEIKNDFDELECKKRKLEDSMQETVLI